MQVDRQELLRHYASLSDEELLDLDRAELTELAQKYYDEEFARRGLTPRGGNTATARALRIPGGVGLFSPPAAAFEAGADWLETAACACAFASSPSGSAAADAARVVLQMAGIPCQVSIHEHDEQPPEYRLMVPGALNLLADSVLDKEIFNAKQEDDWRSHFAELSDDDLRALDVEAMCAGLLDRVARLRRAYREEVERR